MSKRSRHSAALLITLLLVALLAASCGGSEESPVTTVAPPKNSTTVVSVGGTSVLIGTQLRTTDNTPVEYTDAVEEGRPLVVLFYVPAGIDDQKVLESVSRLQGGFPDYAFLIYDFANPGAYGDLSTLLQVDYPPAVIMVDASGTIVTVWNGYVDEGTLNQGLVNLGV